MDVKKRTRPAAGRGATRASVAGTVAKPVLRPLNSPYPGCCKPYPDARFVNQTLVELSAHHQGPHCKGYLEPLDIEAWNAEVDARAKVIPDPVPELSRSQRLEMRDHVEARLGTDRVARVGRVSRRDDR